jgi:hypothetical protein
MLNFTPIKDSFSSLIISILNKPKFDLLDQNGKTISNDGEFETDCNFPSKTPSKNGSLIKIFLKLKGRNTPCTVPK